MIAAVSRTLMTPLPMVEDMWADEMVAYHESAVRILKDEQPEDK